MVGFAPFAGRVDRAAGHRALLPRKRLGRGERIIGRDGHRFIHQPAADRREGDVETTVLVDLLRRIGIGTIRIAAIELPNELLPGIEERGTRTADFSDPSCPSHRAEVGIFALGHPDADALVIAPGMMDSGQDLAGGRGVGVPTRVRHATGDGAPQLQKAVVVAGATAFGGKDAGTSDGPRNCGRVWQVTVASGALIIPIKLGGVGLRLSRDAMGGSEKIIRFRGFVQIIEQTTGAEEFTHHTH